MKYKCLILDHDDTAVQSTPHIHYPAHLEVMRQLRPHMDHVDLDTWFLKNFSPGIMEYMCDELGFTKEEVEQEYEIWRSFTIEKIPPFFPSFLQIIREFKSRGGIVTIVSHSDVDLIKRDYKAAGAGDIPTMIFGWDQDSEKRKPHPYPVMEILKQYGLKPHEALIVDDLKPAVEMSRASTVPIAAAGWGHSIKEIRDYMRSNCLTYLETMDDFRNFLFS